MHSTANDAAASATFLSCMQEFGKTKIYMPPQDDIPVPDKEVCGIKSDCCWHAAALRHFTQRFNSGPCAHAQETDSKKAQLRELTEQIKASGESIRQLKNGMHTSQCT